MVRHTQYAPGTPSWADVASPDLEAARAFYGALFGWTGEPATEPEARGYTVFMQGDAAVAGCGPNIGGPPHWNTYVTVADAGEATAAATAAGGKVLMEAMDVLDAGRMAVISDPTGAALCLWQPLNHIGSELRMEPNTLCWVELATRDPEGALAFYNTLFGWTGTQVGGPESEGGPGYDYLMMQMGDIPVGGIITMNEDWPAEMPAHWMVYFAVTDCDAAAAQVTELGGEVHVQPTDIPPGRFSVVADPHGAEFTVITLNPELFGAEAAG